MLLGELALPSVVPPSGWAPTHLVSVQNKQATFPASVAGFPEYYQSREREISEVISRDPGKSREMGIVHKTPNKACFEIILTFFHA